MTSDNPAPMKDSTTPATTATAKKAAARKATAQKTAATKTAPGKTTARATVKKATVRKATVKKVAEPVEPVEQVFTDGADREVSLGTDAAFAAPAPMPGNVLRSISDIRHAMRTNTTPVFFFGATPFNLLGLDRWVRNFSYVSYYDGWDGAHPRIFTPTTSPMWSSRAAKRSTTGCCATKRSAPMSPRRLLPVYAPRLRWFSSTKRPRRSATRRGTT